MTQSALARLVLALTVGLACGALTGVGFAQQPPTPIPAPRGADVIVMLDVSSSVIGRDDAHSQDIWDALKNSLNSLIDQMPQGTRLAIVPFASGPQVVQNAYPARVSALTDTLPWATLETPRDRQLAKDWLSQQTPNGSDTWIVESLNYSLGQLKLWSQQPGMVDRRQSLYLYTDGLDNKSGQNNPTGWQVQASSLVTDLQNNGLPFLWTAFLQIGDSPPPCPTGFNLCAKPGTSIHLSPESLDFGTMTDKQPSAVRKISMDIQNVEPDADIPLDLQLINAPPGVSIKDQSIHAGPSVDVELDARSGLAPGAHTAILQVRGQDVNFAITNTIGIQFTFQVSPTVTPTTQVTVAPAPTALVVLTPTLAPAAGVTPVPTPTAPAGPPPPPTNWGPVIAVLAVLGFFALGALDNLRKTYPNE